MSNPNNVLNSFVKEWYHTEKSLASAKGAVWSSDDERQYDLATLTKALKIFQAMPDTRQLCDRIDNLISKKLQKEKVDDKVAINFFQAHSNLTFIHDLEGISHYKVALIVANPQILKNKSLFDFIPKDEIAKLDPNEALALIKKLPQQAIDELLSAYPNHESLLNARIKELPEKQWVLGGKLETYLSPTEQRFLNETQLETLIKKLSSWRKKDEAILSLIKNRKEAIPQLAKVAENDRALWKFAIPILHENRIGCNGALQKELINFASKLDRTSDGYLKAGPILKGADSNDVLLYLKTVTSLNLDENVCALLKEVDDKARGQFLQDCFPYLSNFSPSIDWNSEPKEILQRINQAAKADYQSVFAQKCIQNVKLAQFSKREIRLMTSEQIIQLIPLLNDKDLQALNQIFTEKMPLIADENHLKILHILYQEKRLGPSAKMLNSVVALIRSNWWIAKTEVGANWLLLTPIKDKQTLFSLLSLTNDRALIRKWLNDVPDITAFLIGNDLSKGSPLLIEELMHQVMERRTPLNPEIMALLKRSTNRIDYIHDIAYDGVLGYGNLDRLLSTLDWNLPPDQLLKALKEGVMKRLDSYFEEQLTQLGGDDKLVHLQAFFRPKETELLKIEQLQKLVTALSKKDNGVDLIVQLALQLPVAKREALKTFIAKNYSQAYLKIIGGGSRR